MTTNVIEEADIATDSECDNDADLIYNDMEIFCHAINEPQLAEQLKKHKVTLSLLLDFNEDDLIKCGIDLIGDRKKILANIAEMHCEKWVPTSLHDLTGKTLLTAPGIYITLNDINKHIEYIGLSTKYLRKHLQSKPDILELGKDYVGIAKIISELEDLYKTTKATQQQFYALGRQLNKHTDNPLLIPANNIDEKYIRKAYRNQFMLPLILGTFVVYITFKITKFF